MPGLLVWKGTFCWLGSRGRVYACSVCRGTRWQTPAVPTPRCQVLAPGAAPAGQSRWQPSPVPACHSRSTSASARSGGGRALPVAPRSAGKGREKPPRSPSAASRGSLSLRQAAGGGPEAAGPRRRCQLRVLAAAAPGPGPRTGRAGAARGGGRGPRGAAWPRPRRIQVDPSGFYLSSSVPLRVGLVAGLFPGLAERGSAELGRQK